MIGTDSTTESRRHISARPIPIDPRIKARRIEVQRDQGRRRRRVRLVAAAALAVIAAGWGTARSPLLAVDHIEVGGLGHTARPAVLSASGLDRRRQMFDVSAGQVRAALAALPWVGRARVRRQWPNTIAITIVERVPVAQTGGPAGQPALVDAGGRVLATGSEAATVLAAPGPPLPQLAGWPPVGGPGSVADRARQGALSLAVALPPTLAGIGPVGHSVSLQSVSAPGGALQAVLASGVNVVFGTVDQLAAKLVAVETVLARVALTGSATVDVRVPDTPVLTNGK